MLIRKITYMDFSDEPQEITETFHFNLSAIEIFGLEAERKEGLELWFEGLVKEENKKEMFEMFKELILMSYGVRSEDRKEFIKTPELRKKFADSAAYQTLCLELMVSEKALGEFVLGALPKNMANIEEAKRILQGTPDSVATVSELPTMPPVPPSE